jgi:DNA-directed RNA polymerase subunit M/transcription elongation factor TFIIS
MSEHYCPHCKTVLLAETDRAENIRFFLCSNCSRRYALKSGKALTLRWREAVLPLKSTDLMLPLNSCKKAQSLSRTVL